MVTVCAGDGASSGCLVPESDVVVVSRGDHPQVALIVQSLRRSRHLAVG